jgi:putative oxidoreductase
MWAVLHEVRSEYAQALVVAFLRSMAPGRWSMDALFDRAKESSSASERAFDRQQMPDAEAAHISSLKTNERLAGRS